MWEEGQCPVGTWPGPWVGGAGRAPLPLQFPQTALPDSSGLALPATGRGPGSRPVGLEQVASQGPEPPPVTGALPLPCAQENVTKWVLASQVVA